MRWSWRVSPPRNNVVFERGADRQRPASQNAVMIGHPRPRFGTAWSRRHGEPDCLAESQAHRVAAGLFLPLRDSSWIVGRPEVESLPPRLVVILQPEVGDHLLTHEVAESVLQFHRLDEQVVLRVE